MKRLFLLPLIAFIVMFSATVDAQSVVVYQSLLLPRSIISSGMGGQGAALGNVSDAMQYNPAHLHRLEPASLSFYRTELKGSGYYIPFTSVTGAMRITAALSAGVEYTDQDFGTLRISTETYPDGTGEFIHIHERSVAGALALSLGDEWSVGVQARYATRNETVRDRMLFGAGALFTPEIWDSRTTFGFSLTNFGTPVESAGWTIEGTTPSYPMPAQMNLAAAAAVIRHPMCDVTLALGFTKPLDRMDDERHITGQSSFTSLFTDWDEFPRDVTTHIGLGYAWKPLSVGGGVAFFQEMFLGFFTTGPVESFGPEQLRYPSFFTHGVRAGIVFHSVKASAGYAGRWHDHSSGQIFGRRMFPDESFQFTLSTDAWLTMRGERSPENSARPRLVVLTAGYSYCMPVGRMKGVDVYGATDAFAQTSLWSVGADFYLNQDAALIGTLSYGRMTETLTPSLREMWIGKFSGDLETAAISSGLRYHPLDAFHPLFCQASFGVMWLNPLVGYIQPRYWYTALGDLAVGCVLPIDGTSAVVVPKVGLKMMLMETASMPKPLVGFDQFEFGVHVGYTI